MRQKKMQNSFLDFIPARLAISKGNWQIEYYVKDPQTGKMVRKRVRINHIKPVSTRRQYARMMIAEINKRLADGWNPLVEQDAPRSNARYIDAVNAFLEVKRKELKPESFRSYNKVIRLFSEYLEQLFELDKLLLYKIDNAVARKFLRTYYIDNDLSERTYNNYRSFLITVWNWFVENDYAAANPFAATKKLKNSQKNRKIIDTETLERLFEYLAENDKYFYVITQLMYYTLIRPAEILRLRRKHINFEKSIITLTADITKTGKHRNVTMPKKLKQLLIEMNYHKLPENYLLFSEKYRPGTKPIGRNRLTSYWTRLRKRIDIPKQYQLYSLKDTGIVNMLQKGVPPNVVRDQAGHTSLNTTNIYIEQYIGTTYTDILELD